MKPLSWDKQLGLALPLESAAGQSNQTNNPSMDKDEAGDEVGLDASHHTRIFPRGGENLFFLTSSLQELGQQLLSNQQPGLAKFLAPVTPPLAQSTAFIG
jgi:hypothetical protein